MSDTTPLYRRIRRRETRSPRSVLAITLAVLVILASAYAITEMVLHLADQPPLIGDMLTAATATAALADYDPGIVTAAGVLAALVGLLIMIAALTAGRRSRHVLDTPASSAVVDDAVIASALARHAASAGNVSADAVRVSVSQRHAVIRMTPSSGIEIDKAHVVAVAEEQLGTYGLTPSVRPRVIVEEAKVGA
jgi:hypothetical protein